MPSFITYDEANIRFTVGYEDEIKDKRPATQDEVFKLYKLQLVSRIENFDVIFALLDIQNRVIESGLDTQENIESVQQLPLEYTDSAGHVITPIIESAADFIVWLLNKGSQSLNNKAPVFETIITDPVLSMKPGDSMKLEFPNVIDPENEPVTIEYFVDGVILEACDLCFITQLSE